MAPARSPLTGARDPCQQTQSRGSYHRPGSCKLPPPQTLTRRAEARALPIAHARGTRGGGGLSSLGAGPWPWPARRQRARTWPGRQSEADAAAP